MKQEKLTMAVTADHFSLYEAFKTEVEKLGWIYNEKFKPFKPHASIHDCMYFGFNFTYMQGQPAFSLSSTSEKTFQLESEFGQALQMAKQLIDSYYNSIKSVKLNDLYIADIDPKQKTVTIYEKQFGKHYGEQFSFDKIRELTDLIQAIELEYFLQKTKRK